MSRINFVLSWVEYDKFYNLGARSDCFFEKSQQRTKKWKITQHAKSLLIISITIILGKHEIGLTLRKPVFSVSDQVILKPACSDTETC